MSMDVHDCPGGLDQVSAGWNVQDHMFGYTRVRPHEGFTFTLRVSQGPAACVCVSASVAKLSHMRVKIREKRPDNVGPAGSRHATA